ncbi:Transmembrane protein of unknown function [Jatrophihabitans endophyticus]|uniref:DUF3566 domain-containing protein n=1 Tax=Jatrophihabitans endophyticus TaxID=1206085 RepID=A0A1M5HWL1_9ACTN|nr:DUF3566 domain-containing protein [Jatrophihabitans endophyticus]SHG20330.1 Transmembrane protein of unknown function [Jatrophihabitans endophyticus]
MTQSPHSGQAPRTTDFGSASGRPADADSTPTGAVRWGSSGSDGAGAAGNRNAPVAQNPAYGGQVHADAPTGTIPPLVTGTAFPKTAPPANAPAQPATTTPAAGTGTRSGQQRARTARSRGPRRARLQLRHINPWTVLKFSCVLSIALFFVWLIVVGVLFGVLDAAGIIGKINDTVVQLNGPGSNAPVTAGVVFGGAAIIGVVNIVLFIALSTIGSVVYNLCADLVGGVEVTLSER